MSEYQDGNNHFDGEYIGFFTEDAKENLNDVINLIRLISIVFGDKNGKAIAEIVNEEIVSLNNIIHRELQSIKSGLHLSGGIFSWREAEAGGFIKITNNSTD